MNDNEDTTNLGPLDLIENDGIAHTEIEAEQIAANAVPITVADHEATVTWKDGVKVT